MEEKVYQANEVGYLSAWVFRERVPLRTIFLVSNAVPTTLSIPLSHFSLLRHFLPPLLLRFLSINHVSCKECRSTLFLHPMSRVQEYRVLFYASVIS